MTIATAIVALLLAALLGCLGLRWSDGRKDRLARRQLLAVSAKQPASFDPAGLDGLPAPARRYFMATIRAGAAIRTAVDIDMHGELGMGSRDDPKYRPMSAKQLLAPPYGLVWRLRAGPISGSDGVLPGLSWTRFRLLGLIPVVRAGGNEDHRRSAFGRVVAEAAFWSPASLLPGEHVHWEAVDNTTARAIVRLGELEQAVDIGIGTDGLPVRVSLERWSNENPQKQYRRQPFGGLLSEHRQFDGYCLPTRVEGGNHFGTDDYFPFYRVRVDAVRFS